MVLVLNELRPDRRLGYLAGGKVARFWLHQFCSASRFLPRLAWKFGSPFLVRLWQHSLVLRGGLRLASALQILAGQRKPLRGAIAAVGGGNLHRFTGFRQESK